MYLDSCKAPSPLIHLVESYASAGVRLMRLDFLHSRNDEIWTRDAVSALEIQHSEASSLCWRNGDHNDS